MRSLADIIYKIKVFIIATNSIIKYIVSFIKKAKASIKALVVLIVKLS
jgi:hypothetical protein